MTDRARLARFVWHRLTTLYGALVRSRLLNVRVGQVLLWVVILRLCARLSARWLRPSTGAAVVSTAAGQSLYVPAGYLKVRKYASTSYEEAVTGVVSRLLADGMTFVDGGAHLGYYTLLASHRVGPAGRVYAFEPDPAYYDVLLRNVALNRCANVVPVRCALFSHDGVTDLYAQAGSDTGNLYAPIGDPARNSRHRARTCALDSALPLGTPVHVVKLDVEGAEIAVLGGMRRVCAENPGLALIVEFNPETIRMGSSGRQGPADLFAALEQCGFVRFALIEWNNRPLRLPDDLPWLVEVAGAWVVNLLCFRE